MPEKTILFVDDEENILHGLKRSLNRYKKEWNMIFMDSALDALELLETENVQILVTDMLMHEMSGVKLMRRVLMFHPEICRIVLSGHSKREDVLQSRLLAHQYLAKPCKPEKLIEIIENTYLYNNILTNKNIRSVITAIETLPTMTETYNQIRDELESEEYSLKRLGEIISHDVSMSANILRLVNNTYGVNHASITSVEQAVNLLGGEIIQACALSSFALSLIKEDSLLDQNKFRQTSILAAEFAKIIATNLTENETVITSCYIAGLLKNIGLIILVENFEKEYNRVLAKTERTQSTLIQAEQDVLGVTHAEIGAYLLGIWGLPMSVVSAVALHHSPKVLNIDDDLITAVLYITEKFVTYIQEAESPQCDDLDFNQEFCSKMQLQDKLVVCFEKCHAFWKAYLKSNAEKEKS